jgi:hypothetical protein
MRKLLLVAIALIVLLALVSLFTISARQIATSSSPHNHYSVRIDQQRSFPWIERYVYLTAFRDGKRFLDQKLLYTGDFMDNDFRNLYPNYSWLSESILKIGQPETERRDTLHIINGSQQVKYLLIETYVDKFVVFDVQPGYAIDLPFGYFGRLSCQGEFLESRKRFGDAIELLSTDADSQRPPTTFSVTVTADGITIASQLALKHDTCCAADRPDINHE